MYSLLGYYKSAMPKRKRQQKGDGPRKKITLYVRDTKGVVQRDDDGRPLVDKVIWRGHGYVMVQDKQLKTKWTTAPTRDALDKAVDALIAAKRKEVAEAGPDAILDVSGKTPVLLPAPAAKINPHLDTATVNDIMRLFMESDRTRQGPNTKELYHGFWRTHVQVRVSRKQFKPLGQVRLHEFGYDHMKELDALLAKDREAEELYTVDKETNQQDTRWIKRNKLSPKTFADLRNMLRAAFNYASKNHKEYKFEYHPGAYEPLRKWSNQTKTQIAAKDEYYALVEACQTKIAEHPEDHTWKSMLALMTLIRHTLRPAEAQGLQWSDWDAKEGGFRIRRQVVGLKGGERIQDIEDETSPGRLKSFACADTVPISSQLLEYVEITKGISDTWVLPNIDGDKWISRRAFDDKWKTLKKMTGIPAAVTPYTLKHGMIRDLLEAGKSPDQIMFLTRHTTPAMIRKVYGSMEKKSMVDAAGKMHSDYIAAKK